MLGRLELQGWLGGQREFRMARMARMAGLASMAEGD